MIVHEGWPYQPDLCPADDDFIEYLTEQVTPDFTIWPTPAVFHMGPGLHHKVGRWAVSSNLACVAMTNSVEELTSFTQLKIDGADPFGRYACLFGDVQVDKPLMPKDGYRWITLFHLGEAPDERRDALDIEGVGKVYSGLLRRDGELLFYTGSSAYDRVKPILDEMMWPARGGTAWLHRHYKSLVALRRAP